MTVIEITIAGAPTPKGRARSTRTGRHYTPAATRAAENRVRDTWLEANHLRTLIGNRHQPHAGPVHVDVVATFTPPTSWPKWKQAAALAGAWPHTVKPDIDNLLKLVKDGLNGLAWVDDAQAISVTGRKQYGETAATHVTITLLPIPQKPTKENPS